MPVHWVGILGHCRGRLCSVEPVQIDSRSRLPQVRYTRIYTHSVYNSTPARHRQSYQACSCSPLCLYYSHLCTTRCRPTSSPGPRLSGPGGLEAGEERVWSLFFLALHDQNCRTIASLGICSGSLAPLRCVGFVSRRAIRWCATHIQLHTLADISNCFDA